MNFYLDTTPVLNPPITWNSAATSMLGMQEGKTPSLRTEFTTAKANLVDFFSVVRGPLAPTAVPSSQAELYAQTSPLSEFADTSIAAAAVASSLTADIARIAKQRVQLMAAKYASGTESSEVVARLEILNRRLLDRAPRVTKNQVLALENANEQLVRIRAAREARSKRLGIAA